MNTISPAIPKDLVDFLDELFSADHMAPKVSQSDREIWMNAGKRELIAFLKQTRKYQETGADQGFPNVPLHTAVDARTDDYDDASGDASSRSSATSSYASPADRLRG